MKKLFFFLFFVLLGGLASSTKAAAPSVVAPLGNNSFDYVATASSTSILSFTELISTSSKIAVEDAITYGANRNLNYNWIDVASSTLEIVSTSSDVIFYNDVKVANVSDLNGSTTPELLLIDSSLEAGQTEPDISGNATSSSSTPQVVITSPNQEVTMVINNDTDNPSLDASAFVLDGVGVFPKINLIINSGLGAIGVFMPATTTVTSASSTWDGLVAATTTAINLPESYGQNTISPGFELGSTSTMLTFSKAVKISVPSPAERGVVYTRGDGIYHDIPNCTTDSQSWADANLASAGDCKIYSEPYLVIWTKHFTKFYTYEEQPKAAVTYSVNGRALKSGESLIITATFDQDLITAPTITLTGANATSTLMATTSPKIFTYTHIIGLGNGTTTISLSSSTNATSIDIASTPISGATFQVDNTAPAVAITSPVTNDRVKGTKVITFTDNDLTNPTCSINNSVWVNCTSSITTLSAVTGFDSLVDGNFTLYLKDIDNIGNVGTTSQINIYKDTYVPSYGGGGGSSYFVPIATSTTATTTPTIATTTPTIATTTLFFPKENLEVTSGPLSKIEVATQEYIESVIKAEEKLVKTIDNVLSKRLAGRILLQVETLGRAWYLDPVSLSRYYLADGNSAFSALRKFGLGIKNADLTKIPVGLESRFTMTDSDNDGLPDKLEEAIGTDPNKADTDGDGFSDGDEVKNGYNPNGVNKLSFSAPLINRLKGRIVIQTESKGEAWYINPVNGKRYYLANGEAAYQIMRYLSLGISNANIQKIQVSELK